jgi:hypothetical protein
MQNYPGLDMGPCQVSQSPYANFLQNKRYIYLKLLNNNNNNNNNNDDDNNNNNSHIT